MPPVKASQAARSEVNGQPKTLAFQGEDFTIPAELPFTCAAFLQEGEMLNAIRGIVDADDVGRFMEASRGLSVTEWAEKFNTALEDAYGVTKEN